MTQIKQIRYANVPKTGKVKFQLRFRLKNSFHLTGSIHTTMAAIKGLFALGGAGLAGFYLGTQQRPVQSHCQVPCGIYDDSGRIAGMKEDVNTISKAIRQVRKKKCVSPPLASLANDVSWLARPFHCPTRYIYIHTYRLTRDCLVCFSCFFLHIKKVNLLSSKVGAGDATALNQATRWITTKDEHASKIITTTAEYFLTQKVATVAKDDADHYQAYLETLAAHHRVLKAAMKTKQGVSDEAAHNLAHMVDDLGAIYGK